MPKRRRRTPQERKELSLARDTVDAGEYPKAFRRKHPLQQARAERAARRELRRRLAEGREDVPEVRRREVRKWPPARLGDLVRGKLARREQLRESPRKSPEARERRRRRRRRPG
jgi:hypothetical protein